MDNVPRINADDGVLDIPVVANLEDLITGIRLEFNSDRVDVKRIVKLMSAYVSDPQEWIQYAEFDQHAYTRNLVDEVNGKYNLILLAWGEGQGSKIHDHANSNCCMKVLSGCLYDVRYSWPEKSEESKEMKAKADNKLDTNAVAFINNALGLHLMENRSLTATAVSLHLYYPPLESVFLFDQRTGHTTKGNMTFWSKYGERTNTSCIRKP